MNRGGVPNFVPQIEIEKWSCNDPMFSNIVNTEKVHSGKGCFVIRLINKG